MAQKTKEPLPATLTNGINKNITFDQIRYIKTTNPDLSAREGGLILGCSEANIKQHCRRNGTTWAGIIKEIENYKNNRADVLAGLQDKLLRSVTDETIKKANIRDLAIAYGTFYDKERLERGQSTQNHVVAQLFSMMGRTSSALIGVTKARQVEQEPIEIDRQPPSKQLPDDLDCF